MMKRLGPAISTLILLLATHVQAQERPTVLFLAAAKNGVPITPPSSFVDAVPGDIITLEAFTRCWSNGRSTADPIGGGPPPPLRGYQFVMDFDSYFSGLSGNVLPVNYENTTGTCLCELEFQTCPSNSTNAFVDGSRNDFVFRGLLATFAVDTNQCGYRTFAGILCIPSCPQLLSVCPPRNRFYLGTVRLQVSNDASGVFRVCPDDRTLFGDPVTRLATIHSPGQEPPIIVPLDLECLTINVPVDNCPGTLVASDPSNNAIDARQPSLLNDATSIGTDVVALTFAEGDDTSCLKQSSFSLDVFPPGVAPFVEAVGATPNETTVEAFLNGPIPAGKWTRITHEDDSPTSVCLGYLPLDVDGNGTSNAADLLRLMACLESKATCALSEADLDRSGMINVTDITRGVDLHNGAGQFQTWANVTLPASPCN